jgi:4-carboxymuconolactone decarboxylase
LREYYDPKHNPESWQMNAGDDPSLLFESLDAVPLEIRDDWRRYVERTVVDMWDRQQLSKRNRSMITVAALSALRDTEELRTQIRVALRNAVSRPELCELMMQVAGYAGFSAGRAGMAALKEVFDAEPAAKPAPSGRPLAPVESQDRVERGLATLAKLQPARAPAAPSRALAAPFAPDWRAWLIGTAFGDLWPRPGLSFAERERITLAVLIALGREAELHQHCAIASNLGITPEEIGEEIMHLAVYIGFPTAVTAMRVAVGALGEIAKEGK